MDDLYELRLMVAKAVRMLDYAGLIDMNGHVSLRVPGTDTLLINSRLASRTNVTAGDIVQVGLDRASLTESLEPPSETYIHTEIMRARSDVNAVVHAHPHYTTVLTIAKQKILPVFGIGAVLGDVPVYEDPDLVNTKEKGRRLAEALGTARVVAIQSHGAVITADTLQGAFVATVYLEENAKKQAEALSINSDIYVFSDEERERVAFSNWNDKTIRKTWDYWENSCRFFGRLQGVEVDRPTTVGT